MNVVDSSGWLEYFADGPNAEFFAAALQSSEKLVVPTLAVVEVFRRVAQQRGESAAIEAVSLMQAGSIVPLDFETALLAGRLGVQLRLPLADSVLLATARRHDATLWTQDGDFEGLEGVQYRAKPKL